MTMAPSLLIRKASFGGLLALFVMLSSATAIAQQVSGSDLGKASTQLLPKGTISGKVTRDDGEPIAGAGVNFLPVSIDDRARTNPKVVVRYTDLDGNFNASDLAYGSYRVLVSAPGYIDRNFNRNPEVASNSISYRPGDFVSISLTLGGVITGKVTDLNGDPAVAATVIATRVKDVDGIRPAPESIVMQGVTDDRGVYRIYGLPGGSYLVKTNGVGFGAGATREVFEYHPGGPIAAAHEIAVTPGSETTGIDIRHDGQIGYRVSGVLSGIGGEGGPIFVGVYSADTRQLVSSTTYFRRGVASYSVAGLMPGEYYAIGRQSSTSQQVLMAADSAPRRFTVKASNVTGVDLKLRPTAAFSGSVNFKGSGQSCSEGKQFRPNGLTLAIQPEANFESNIYSLFGGLSPDNEGKFAVTGVPSGRIRYSVELPAENWYVRSFTMPVPGAAKPTLVSAAGWVSLSSGSKVEGISIEISDGAASLTGHASVGGLGRAYLVPAGKDLAADLSRYYESVGRGGNFALRNIAPGRYYLLWKGGNIDEASPPEALDPVAREVLRADALARGKEIELAPCQKMSGVKLAK